MKTASQATEEKTWIIAVDPGFGGMKVATVMDNEMIHCEVIPSVVGVGTTRMGLLNAGFRTGKKEEPLAVVFDGTSYLVGHNVARYARPRERLDFLRLAEGPELRALLYAALWKITGPGRHTVNLMLGLPVEVIKDDAQAQTTMRKLREWVVGEHGFTVNREETTIRIVAVNATSQPLGALFAWGANLNGGLSAEMATGTIAVCDIGFNTLDLFVIRNGQVDKHQTGGDRLGMHRVADAVIRHVRDTYKVALTMHEADDLVRAYANDQPAILYHAGGDTDLGGVIARELEESFIAVNQLIRQYWDQGTQFRHFLVTGGGAGAFRKKILDFYPFACLLPRPVTANAIGIALLAQRKYGAKRPKTDKQQ